VPVVSQPAVEADGLTRRFGGLIAVGELSLRVEAGTTYGLLGPSGCGKTTLIRLLTGLVRPTAGTARILGRDPTDPDVRRQVGYMPQTASLYEELTARQNVAFFAEVYGADSGERVEELLALVELRERADVPVASLSGGMRRRTSLACALVHRPRVLFLDEPTVGVDPRLRAAFWAYFRRLGGEGVTIIVTSHIMDEAERCDQLGLMRAGRLIAEGSSAEIRRRAGTATLEEAFLVLAGPQEDEP
jgi:ABC-2 type transport system ATP-binding protein